MQTKPDTRRESKRERCKRIKEQNKKKIAQLQSKVRDPDVSNQEKIEAERDLDRLKKYNTRKISVLENGAAAPPGEEK